MKSIYFVAGLFVMLVQGSWQRSTQDTEEKYSSFQAPHPDSLNYLHQIHKEKRFTDQEILLMEYEEFLQNDCVRDFVDWMLDENNALDDLPVMLRRRHADGSFSDEMNTVHDNLPTQEHLK